MDGDFRKLSFQRAALAAVVVVDLCSYLFYVGDARAIALANGITLTGFGDLVSRLPVRAAIVLIGIAGAVAFGSRPGRLWEGMLALGALALLSSVHAQLFGSPWRHLFFSGLCLLGWLLGLAVSRQQGTPTDESWARAGSIALLGAAYLNSGISKIVFGGFEWLSGLPIQVAVIGQYGLVADSILSGYRSWAVDTPEAARAFSVATLGFELAGPLMLVGPKTRSLVALGLVGMHTNIYLLTSHILYWEPMVLLALFAFSSDRIVSETGSTAAAPIRWIDRAFAGSAALLLLCALLAVGHQARRYAHSHDSQSAAMRESAPGPSGAASPASSPGPSEAPASAPSTVPLRHVGPFTVGQELVNDWSVEALDLSDAGVVISLSGTPGRVRFELTCAASERRSPFDLGAANLFYFLNDLPLSEVHTVGRALQARIRQAAGDHDVCAALASWRSSALAGLQR